MWLTLVAAAAAGATTPRTLRRVPAVLAPVPLAHIVDYARRPLVEQAESRR